MSFLYKSPDLNFFILLFCKRAFNTTCQLRQHFCLTARGECPDATLQQLMQTLSAALEARAANESAPERVYKNTPGLNSLSLVTWQTLARAELKKDKCPLCTAGDNCTRILTNKQNRTLKKVHRGNCARMSGSEFINSTHSLATTSVGHRVRVRKQSAIVFHL
jgi:hypothetical protein